MARMAGLFLHVILVSGLPKGAIGGIGIGVPGVLDLENGRVVFPPDLPGKWVDLPLR